MLEIEGLSVRFRRYGGLWRREEFAGLTDVTLSVAPGELLALVGSSGAGKSLLAHAVLGILPSNAVVEGKIRFENEVLNTRTRAGLRGRRIALVPQSIAHLDPLARVGDQLRWAARRSGGGLAAGTAGRVAARADMAVPALAAFGLAGDVARAYPHALSGGMARRVLLATAMAGNADLVIADEPTDGLDPANAERVLKVLRSLADRGKAVIMVTHDLVSAVPFADRVAVMREGTLLGVEPAEDFCGDGARLGASYARDLWRALPENGFAVPQERVDA